VIGTMGLVQAGFARILAEDGLPADVLAAALGAWSRYLSVHLDLTAACAEVDGSVKLGA